MLVHLRACDPHPSACCDSACRQMVKAYREAVEQFECRVQQLTAMLLRLLQQVSNQTLMKKPEQLQDLLTHMTKARDSVQVRTASRLAAGV